MVLMNKASFELRTPGLLVFPRCDSYPSSLLFAPWAMSCALKGLTHNCVDTPGPVATPYPTPPHQQLASLWPGGTHMSTAVHLKKADPHRLCKCVQDSVGRNVSFPHIRGLV